MKQRPRLEVAGKSDREALQNAREVVTYLEDRIRPPKVDPRIALIDKHLNGMGITIITAAEKTGLDLAAACALVEQESGGKNIFGCDAGGPFCHLPVTPERIEQLTSQRGYKSGSAPMQGVGLTQLTWYSYVLDAEKRGGAEDPLIQCLVGFEILRGYFRNYGAERAWASYNAGEGNWTAGKSYAAQAMAKAQVWRGRLADVKEPDPNPGPDGELLPHGVRDGTNFATAYKVALKLVGREYWVWHDGPVPSGEGMYAVNKPLPPLDQIGRVNCTGLGNIMRRAAGKIVPTRGNELYDGGVAAYFYCPADFGFGPLGPGFFSDVDVPFNLKTAKAWAEETGSGVACGAIYQNNTLAGQGHFSVLLPDGMVLQSISLGGVNIKYTIEQSNAGDYYDVMIHPRDWINHDKNQF